MSEIALLREALEDHRRELARLRKTVRVAHAEIMRGRYVSAEWKLRSALSESVATPAPPEPAPVDPPRGGCKHLRTETDHGKPWTCLDCGRIYAGILSKWVDPPAPEPEERCPLCQGCGAFDEEGRATSTGYTGCAKCGGTGLAPGKGNAK
jgi:hypothetical protein